jgi:hypothetical protein
MASTHRFIVAVFFENDNIEVLVPFLWESRSHAVSRVVTHELGSEVVIQLFDDGRGG